MVFPLWIKGVRRDISAGGPQQFSEITNLVNNPQTPREQGEDITGLFLKWMNEWLWNCPNHKVPSQQCVIFSEYYQWYWKHNSETHFRIWVHLLGMCDQAETPPDFQPFFPFLDRRRASSFSFRPSYLSLQQVREIAQLLCAKRCFHNGMKPSPEQKLELFPPMFSMRDSLDFLKRKPSLGQRRGLNNFCSQRPMSGT